MNILFFMYPPVGVNNTHANHLGNIYFHLIVQLEKKITKTQDSQISSPQGDYDEKAD